MKKKILLTLITILIACITMFSLTACGGNNDNGNNSGANTNIDLYDCGLEVASTIGEMVNSEEYIYLAGANHLDLSKISGSQYNSPNAVYSISIPSKNQLMTI